MDFSFVQDSVREVYNHNHFLFNNMHSWPTSQVSIREVWNYNLDQELELLSEYLSNYKMISIDTEFPGHVVNMPRNSSDFFTYENVKSNVNLTKLIQLGLTVTDGVNFCTWEFNFQFDYENDRCNSKSIRFLMENNLDFESLRTQGIDVNEFAEKFKCLISIYSDLKWITFHGLYDLAYLVKILWTEPLLPNSALPNSLEVFAEEAGKLFNTIFDIKCIAEEKLFNTVFDVKCIAGEKGLEGLARKFDIERIIGSSHHAGSDSLLTAKVFLEIYRLYPTSISSGNLYGMKRSIGAISHFQSRGFPVYDNNNDYEFLVPENSL